MDPLSSLRQTSLRQLESLINAQTEVQRLASLLARRRSEGNGLVFARERLLDEVQQMRKEQSRVEGLIVQDLQTLQSDTSHYFGMLVDRMMEMGKKAIAQTQETDQTKQRFRKLEEEANRMRDALRGMGDYQDIKSERKKSISELQQLRRTSTDLANELETLREENKQLREERKALEEDSRELKVPG